jgi:hypothetical protein
MPKLIAVFFLLLLALCLPEYASAQSQTTGRVKGIVRDINTKVPIPGAVVIITNLAKNVPDSARTNAAGEYSFDFIETGEYALSTTCEGYDVTPVSKIDRLPVNLRIVNEVTPPPLELLKQGTAPAAPATPVATAAPPAAATTTGSVIRLVNLEDATRSLGFDAGVIAALPLAEARSFDQLALLAAGVALPPQTIGNITGPGLGAGVGTSGQFAVNGLRSRGNNFTVDGSDNNDEDIGVRRQGFTALVPQAIETLQQLNIATLLPRPQFGRNLGAQVDAVSQYGGSRVHGGLYGFYTDRRLRARDAFDLRSGGAPANFALTRSDNLPVLLLSGGTSLPLSFRNPVGGENPLTRGQFGGNLGGPIGRKQTFFFASYEHRELNARRESNFAVPLVAERGLFNSGDRGLTVSSGQMQRLAYPSTAKGEAFFSLFPFPNNPRGPYGANTFTEVLPADARGEIASFRGDRTFRAWERQQSFAVRYNVTDDNTTLPVTGEALFSTMKARVRTHNVAFIWSGALSSQVSQTARFSFGRTRLAFDEVRNPFLLPSKLKDTPFLLNANLRVNGTLPGQQPNYVAFEGGTEFDTDPLGQMIVSGFSPVGVDVYNFAQGRANNTFQAAETVSYNAGRHRVMGGADFRRTQLNSRLDRNFRPVVYFGGAVDVSGQFGVTSPFVQNTNGLFRGIDFIATGAATGFFHTLSLDGDSNIALRFWQGNVFAEDQISLAPNFKLTFGARYELNSVPRDVNNRIEVTFNSPEVRALIAEEKRATGVSGFELYLGGRNGIFQPDRNNIAPHMAFAWDPRRDGRTVIRGGYGIYFDQIPGAVISQSRSVFPRFLTVNLAGVSENRQSFIAFNPQRLAKSGALNVFDPNAKGALGRNFLDYLVALNRLAQGPQGSQIAASPSFVLPVADLVTPYAQHWTLTFERELLPGVLTSLAYVGTKGTNLLRFATPNLGPNGIPVVTGGTVFANEISFNGLVVAPGSKFKRPYPLLGSFTTIESNSNSSYHSLQAEASMRLSSRFKFTSAYTWSHAIDEVSDLFDLAGVRGIPQNSFNRGGERGDANFDVRHRFAGSFVWDFPFWSQSRLWGGWQLAGIAALQTGQPFTVVSSVDVNLDGNLTDRLHTAAGVGEINRGSLRYSFPDAIAAQRALLAAAGADGAVGRNTFRAPGVVTLDLALNKLFRFREANSLELRAEAFNFFNRTHFGVPVRQLFAPGVGRSVSTTVPARTVQFAIRYKF